MERTSLLLKSSQETGTRRQEVSRSAYGHTCTQAHTGPGGEEHRAARSSHGADIALTEEQQGDRNQETGGINE